MEKQCGQMIYLICANGYIQNYVARYICYEWKNNLKFIGLTKMYIIYIYIICVCNCANILLSLLLLLLLLQQLQLQLCIYIYKWWCRWCLLVVTTYLRFLNGFQMGQIESDIADTTVENYEGRQKQVVYGTLTLKPLRF